MLIEKIKDLSNIIGENVGIRAAPLGILPRHCNLSPQKIVGPIWCGSIRSLDTHEVHCPPLPCFYIFLTKWLPVTVTHPPKNIVLPKLIANININNNNNNNNIRFFVICIIYINIGQHLPSSHHPIFFCLVSHSTSNHIQRLMLQSVPYRICNVVLSINIYLYVLPKYFVRKRFHNQ